MTIQAIEKIAYAAFEHFNRKMKTNYSSDNVKLACYYNSDADEQYRRFCKENILWIKWEQLFVLVIKDSVIYCNQILIPT